jgi:DNA helicase-2/ATP-dependent DNA helicase PcrA
MKLSCLSEILSVELLKGRKIRVTECSLLKNRSFIFAGSSFKSNRISMFNKSETDECNYLDEIKNKLSAALNQIDENVKKQSNDLVEQKRYLYENKSDMDHAEKVAVHQSVHSAALTGEAALERKKRIQKLMLSPYFGRFDFRETPENEPVPIYVGVHAYYDEKEKNNLVHDWRAPISSMFYDYENGPVRYESPSGMIDGEMLLKRQFRIRKGKMEYMLESSMNIHDDVLQKELSKSSDDKMKHIVATIQRDQNAIIRNEESRTLIIQGVAGSGKTSIALHRIAFLLYRFKDTITSNDILILSPNKVFADYISNVLPELGEENIPEMGMEELADKLLEGKYRFQTFFEQVTDLLEKKDEDFAERIRFKSSHEFITKLNDYLSHIENQYFTPVDLVVRRNPVPASYIDEKFRSLHRLPLFKRFNEVVAQIERDLLFYNRYEINATERNYLRKEVRKMFKVTNLRELYKDFYNWLEKPGLFKFAKRSAFEYADIFPLVYLKIKLEGTKTYDEVKHLLVDEMQDYTPVQYAVLAKLFPGKKTILGDAYQTVNPYSSSSSKAIERVMPGAELVKLNKSYRSTYEIATFARQILPKNEVEAMERHGKEPLVKGFKTSTAEQKWINESVGAFDKSVQNSMGVVCKTQKQAVKLYKKLSEQYPAVHLLTSDSVSFSGGVIITTVHLAKGLEFDEVLIPNANATTYNDETDRGLFYIACTRAMHMLSITYSGECTPFIGA